MFAFLLVLQILVSVSIIALVLLQHGKGADMGAAFGSGSSGTVFGARGSGSFLTRTTAILAAVFFVNCLLIASPLVRETSVVSGDSVADQLEQQVQLQRQAAEGGDAPAPQAEEAAVQAPAAASDLPEVVDQVPAAAGDAANDVPAVAPEAAPADAAGDAAEVPGEAPAAAGDVPDAPAE